LDGRYVALFKYYVDQQNRADFLTRNAKAVRPCAAFFMATKTIIKPAKSPAAVGPYNHAVRVDDLMFCAGQIPIDPKTGNLVFRRHQDPDRTRAAKRQSDSGRPKIDNSPTS